MLPILLLLSITGAIGSQCTNCFNPFALVKLGWRDPEFTESRLYWNLHPSHQLDKVCSCSVLAKPISLSDQAPISFSECSAKTYSSSSSPPITTSVIRDLSFPQRVQDEWPALLDRASKVDNPLDSFDRLLALKKAMRLATNKIKMERANNKVEVRTREDRVATSLRALRAYEEGQVDTLMKCHIEFIS